MKGWDHVINTSLLGTDKQVLHKTILPAEVAASFDLIQGISNSKEDAFFQVAAVFINYKNCGYTPLHQESITTTRADKESKVYANALSHSALADILETGSIALLHFWLRQCLEKGRIVQPDVIPDLLEVANKNKTLRPSIQVACGNRGAWLSRLNESWQFELPGDQEVWATGTLDQRKELLTTIREKTPATGREMLQDVWMQENAAGKVELLKGFALEVTEEDLHWLESLLAEKSQKVRDEALGALKKLPASSIVKNYWNVLAQSVKLTSTKGLFGIGAKTTIEMKLVPFDPALFKSGIQQLTSEAGVTDESFILYQLMSAVPPHFWEEHLALDRNRIINLFQKEDDHKSYISAFGLAAAHFRNLDWLRAVMEADKNAMHIDAFYLLPQQEAETYALKFLATDDGASSILHNINFFSAEWGMAFSDALLLYTVKNPYQYNKAFYNRIAHLLPAGMLSHLESLSPQEAHLKSMWSNLSEYLVKLLELKVQTLKAFNQ